MTEPTDLDMHRASVAFGQGRSCARKGGYLSDNPHAYESEPWLAWRAGFDEGDEPVYRVARAR